METPDNGRKGLPFGEDVMQRMTRLLDSLGLELCHAEWKAGRSRSVLSLTIDRKQSAEAEASAPASVSLDDCEKASRAVDTLLDEEPVASSLPADWSLEVSSPGLDRPLWSVGDCLRFRGRRVKVQTKVPVEGTSRMKGTLETVDGDLLTVLDEDRNRRYTVRFGDVKVARLVPEY
jgi:ribosome maturation factor RimP